MENRSHALLTGLFTIGLLASLVTAAAWLGGREGPRVPYVIVSKVGVGGLNHEAAVRYRGVDVGKVERVRFDPDDRRQILIDVSVAPETYVSTRTYGRLGFQGVTGLAFVELADDAKEGTLLSSSPLKPARIEMHPSALQEFGDAGQALLVRVNEIAERMSFLLNEENQVKMANSLGSIERLTARFVSFQDKLIPILDSMPRLTGRADEVLVDGKSLVAEMREVTRQMQTQLAVFDRVGVSADEMGTAATDFYGTTLPGLNRLAEKLSRTAESLDRVLEAHSREPQSLIFGAAPAEPGPGEPGFSARPRERE
jgi:phospholipid/cholesterol/gamma-HCH transport system substrate-binding protein